MTAPTAIWASLASTDQFTHIIPKSPKDSTMETEFTSLLKKYSEIKETHVTRRLKFYLDRVNNKRRLAQWSRAGVLLLSLIIPIVANFGGRFGDHFPKDLTISIMSLLIALAAGLEGMHQWQQTWKDYSRAIVQIETLVGVWEIEILCAERLANVEDASKALDTATKMLLSSVERVVSAEMEGFFSERSRATGGQQALAPTERAPG